MFTRTIDKTPSVPNSSSSKEAQKRYVGLPVLHENELLNIVSVFSDPFSLASACGLPLSSFAN